MSVIVDIDLRSSLGGARDQGLRPTCLVFAVSAAHEAKRRSDEYLSPEYLFYRGAQRSHKDPSKGLTRTIVREALMLDGQPAEAGWPYLQQPPDPMNWAAPVTTDPIHKAIIDFAPRTFQEVCRVLGTGTPVLLVIALTLAMYTPDAHAIVRSRAADTVSASRHAVLAVGSGHADDGDYLLVRNSWGPTWGEAGHGWIHERYLTPHLQMTGIVT